RPALGSGEALSRRAARGNACHQKPLERFGIRQKAVAAKRYWAGAYRFDPLPAMAPRRHRSWSATALVRLHISAEEVTRSAALGAGREICGRQADRGECV